MQIPLIKGDKVDNNVDYRDALPVNYYAVMKTIKGVEGYMLNYYGLTELAQGEGVSRGAIWVARPTLEGHYRVSGQSFIRVNDNGSVTVLGEVLGGGQASLTYSLNNIAIVASNRLYYYNKISGLREITSSGVVGDIVDIVWADFRFIATDGEYLYQSSELDEEVFEPAAFVGSDFQPDSVVGVGLDEDNELIAFNSFSTEYFRNIGDENFSYVRIEQKAIKAGIIGTHCKAEHEDQWYCLTRRENTQPQFSIIQSGTWQSITNREIEKVLAEYTDDQLSTTVIEVFTKDATTWMQANLPDKTLMLNVTLMKSVGIDYAWSILKSDVLGDDDFRAKDCLYDPRFSKWIVGDKIDGTIGYLDDSECTHYGDVVEGLLYTPVIHELETLSINEIRVETIPGIAPSNDATVFISRSDDMRVDGNEWTQLYGDNYDYNQRFIITRLGVVNHDVSFRIRTASRSRMSFCNFNLSAS